MGLFELLTAAVAVAAATETETTGGQGGPPLPQEGIRRVPPADSGAWTIEGRVAGDADGAGL